MKSAVISMVAMLFLPAAALGAEPANRHFPNSLPPPAGLAAPGVTARSAPFSGAVLAGDTLYVSGAIDLDPATGKLGSDATEGAKLTLDALKGAVETAGMSMDDLVWVQVFCTDLSYFPKFNDVYRTYFKGPPPARAFLGVDHLLGGAHFEVMGVAVKPRK
jgi:2-iminobutanoate/2-iminopropanoate deaminase